jgi:hypothetical protein
MWMSMAEGDTQQTCSQQNRGISFLIAAVVQAAPAFMMLRGYIGAQSAKSTDQLLRVLRRGLKLVGGVCLSATVTTAVLMKWGNWDSCTIEGPYGHQIWAMLMVPDPTLGMQQWLYPGWIEALPSYLPFPFIRVGEDWGCTHTPACTCVGPCQTVHCILALLLLFMHGCYSSMPLCAV